MGEIGRHPGFRQSPKLKKKVRPMSLPISPLVGEMSGGTEGGAKDRYGAVLRCAASALKILRQQIKLH
ncbi:hypothetical protein ABID19_005303 [Mesorhizobium robiniae]|uniref:Uncharacterized protein n=1 Tax=Mesorhizobium robiniae TaxID=559315 RepID=A0ABV2GVC2_9HYPH